MKTILLAALVALASIKGYSQSPAPAGEIWQARISRIQLNDASLQSAMEALFVAFKRDHPSDSRVVGIMIVAQEKTTLKVTCDLQNVPLGEACKLFANVVGYHVSLHNKSLCFYPPDIEGIGETTEVLPLTSQVIKNLNLKDPKNPEQLRAALADKRVYVKAIFESKIFEASGMNYLIATGDCKELAILRSLWTLLDRK